MLHSSQIEADAALLLDIARELSGARSQGEVAATIRRSARGLVGADGVTFVLREGDLVHYAEEDAISPLWVGRRFPAASCISGWAMTNRRTVLIEDVYADDRIPHDVYRPTFVKSLAMVPVRVDDPVAAIGAYWGTRHMPSGREVQLLESLAGLAAVALANASLYAELRSALRLRDELLDVASHELRTPLTAIRLQTEVIARALGDGAGGPVATATERITRNAQRLNALIERLLDVSRMQSARGVLARARVDLGDLAHRVAERLTVGSDGGVTVDCHGSVVGHWDPMRVEQILESLISNAIKFGAGRPVRIVLEDAGSEARVVVHDQGIGIPADALCRIFERFERAVPDPSYTGFGLGLWIAREAAVAHRGRITVESEPGAGSRFTVLLPKE
jgi:signal transduction histidine kinase